MSLQSVRRADGLGVAGIARILDYLPAADARRGEYVQLLQTMLAALAPLQGSDGLWRSELLNPNAFPNPETSGTGFFYVRQCLGNWPDYVVRAAWRMTDVTKE